MFPQHLSYVYESFNKMPLVTHDIHKGSDVSVGLGRQAGNDGGDIFLRRFNSILVHMMSQINELHPEQITLSRLKFEAVLTEAVKYDTHPLEMFFWSLRVDYDIIQINEAVC